MSTDLGEYVTRSVQLYDSTGAAVAADSLPTYAVTLPDGTAGTPPAVQGGATGEYFVNYLTTVAGRHEDTWTALVSGLTRKFGPDSFHVRAATQAPLVPLADIRRHVGITSPDPQRDEQLRDFAESATRMLEKYLDIVARRQVVTEAYDGGGPSLLLRKRPVISITSVTEYGSALSPANDYVLDPIAGLLHRGTINAAFVWIPGRQNITVTYVAGLTIVPDDYVHTVKELVRYLWDSQRGGSGLPNQGGADEFNPKTPFSILRDNLNRDQAGIF